VRFAAENLEAEMFFFNRRPRSYDSVRVEKAELQAKDTFILNLTGVGIRAWVGPWRI
jgi:hypothetical protein